MFRRAPAFTITAIAALALGIGTNTAIFSVVNTVLLRPLAFTDPERMVLFQNSFRGGSGGSTSPNEFNFWRQQTQTFRDISAYAFNVANLTGDSSPEQLQTARATADFFRLCGAEVLQGRTYNHEEYLPRAPKTAVLAYAFWQAHFGADPHVVGKRITMSGESYEIIGVVCPNLKIEIDQPPDVYVPFQLDPVADDNGHCFQVIGRIKSGITLDSAKSQLQAAYTGYRTLHPPPPNNDQIRFTVQLLQDALVGGVRRSLIILVAAVSSLLLRCQCDPRLPEIETARIRHAGAVARIQTGLQSIPGLVSSGKVEALSRTHSTSRGESREAKQW